MLRLDGHIHVDKYGKNIVCSVSVLISAYSVSHFVVFDFVVGFCKFVSCVSRVPFQAMKRAIRMHQSGITFASINIVLSFANKEFLNISLDETRVWPLGSLYIVFSNSHSIDLHGHLQIHRYQ